MAISAGGSAFRSRPAQRLPEQAATVRRCLAALLLAVCLFALGAVQVRAAEVVDKIVAVVNGQIITLYDLDRELRPYLMQLGDRQLTARDRQQVETMRRKLLDRLVDDILLLREAERLGMQVSDSEVENHIRQFRQSNNMAEADLSRQLRIEGMTREEYVSNIRSSMLRHRVLSLMVRRKVLVTDEEIERHYNENQSEYSSAKEVELGLILMSASRDAQGLARRLRSGDISFEEAAKQYSNGPGARSGGGIGRLRWTEIAPEWRAALERVRQGEITEPFAVGNDQAILKLMAIRPGAERSLDSVREEIRQKLHEPKFVALYAEYMQRLKEKAIIDIRF